MSKYIESKDESVILNDKSEFGFHGCLEAEAFQVILEKNNVIYTKNIMEEMDAHSIDNPERFEEVFTVEGDQKLSLMARDIFNGSLDDGELFRIIDRC